MLAYAAILYKLQRRAIVQQFVLIVLLLRVVKRLATLVGCTYGVHKIVKFANSSKLAEELKLILWSRCSELLFKLANSLAVYCSLNDEVNNVACAAYVVARVEVKVRVFVQRVDGGFVVVGGVVPHKAVEFSVISKDSSTLMITAAWAAPVWSPYRLRKAISTVRCLLFASIMRISLVLQKFGQ